MALKHDFLERLEDFLAYTGLSASAVSIASCGHNKVIARMRSGGNPSIRTIEKLEELMLTYIDGGIALPLRRVQ